METLTNTAPHCTRTDGTHDVNFCDNKRQYAYELVPETAVSVGLWGSVRADEGESSVADGSQNGPVGKSAEKIMEIAMKDHPPCGHVHYAGSSHYGVYGPRG